STQPVAPLSTKRELLSTIPPGMELQSPAPCRSSSNCTTIHEFPHDASIRRTQVADRLSFSRKYSDLNVQERQVFSVTDLRPLSVVNHISDDGLDIIDGVDAEVLEQVLLGFPLEDG